jgi:cardiolipin synthase A/B
VFMTKFGLYRTVCSVLLPLILLSTLGLSACGGGGGESGVNISAPGLPRLLVEPDDGRAPIIAAIAGATNNIRLTIYQITDLESVAQTPPAPADSIVAALISKAQSGVSVRVIVDYEKYSTGSGSLQIQQTVDTLRDAGAIVHTSSTAFCVTHQKTFVIDGPTAANPGLTGTAIIISLNLMPGYFGGTRDYAVVTGDQGVVQEVSRVFDSDFLNVNTGAACSPRNSSAATFPPPHASDTPALSEVDLLWSPVSSKSKLLQLIGSAQQSLVMTTEELEDASMVCAIRAVAQAPAGPPVRILLSGDDGSNASGVKTLLDLGLPNLSIRVMPGQQPPGSPTVATTLYMHGKQVIADGARAFVGSENMTNTSLIQNRELGTFFTNPGMIARLQSAFTSDFTTPSGSYPATACAGCATISCPP